MAFRQPAAPRQSASKQANAYTESSLFSLSQYNHPETESQEWVLFSPSQDTSTTIGTQTAGLSHISDFGSLECAAQTGESQDIEGEDELTDDAELDSLDDGLQAFREPSHQRSFSNTNQEAVLPTHDGLGKFPDSNGAVQDQIWQYERYNPKRKHSGRHHRRGSSGQPKLDTIAELELQISEEKRLRIEKWRTEQSRVLINEIEQETRRKPWLHSPSLTRSRCANVLPSSTPTQNDINLPRCDELDETEPFWRRITRKFIRDVIGIDEPLLSVILGETLCKDSTELSTSHLPQSEIATPTSDGSLITDDNWRDRLLERIARELGLLVSQLSPHPGAFGTVILPATAVDYAGIPISHGQYHDSELSRNASAAKSTKTANSNPTPDFTPTAPDSTHIASWGLEDDSTSRYSPTLARDEDNERFRREQEYWERELDVKMIFHFLRARFSTNASVHRSNLSNHASGPQDFAKRAAIIRQHHPLVAGAQHPCLAGLRQDSTIQPVRRPPSSCASESMKSSLKASQVKSATSSRNYWDIGGSVGSGSVIASGGLIGTWGEA